MRSLPESRSQAHVEAFRSTGTSPGHAIPSAPPRPLGGSPRLDAPAAPVIVLKFGSSLLSGIDGYLAAAAEIFAEVEKGRRVVAVCSAERGVTDALSAAAAKLGPEAPDELVARLLATGENASVALLALALASRGVEAHALDAAELGVRTSGRLLDADPVHVDAGALHARLARRPVLVVPGFAGVDGSGAPSLLGRGGSDLTALFLADALDAAECRLVKDVEGLFPADPRCEAARPFERATWEDVLRIGGRVVQAKAVHFAWRHRRAFRIAAPGAKGTWVGDASEVVR